MGKRKVAWESEATFSGNNTSVIVYNEHIMTEWMKYKNRVVATHLKLAC